jgi:hypothetical protein
MCLALALASAISYDREWRYNLVRHLQIAGLVYLGGELDEVAGDVIGELDVDFWEKRPRGSSTSCKKNTWVSKGTIFIRLLRPQFTFVPDRS